MVMSDVLFIFAFGYNIRPVRMRKTILAFCACLMLLQLSGCEKVSLDGEDTEGGNSTEDVTEDPPSSGVDTLYSDVEPTEGSEVRVGQFLHQSIGVEVYVKGYIVGSCQRSIKNADFDAPFEGHTALLLADSKDERTEVITIHLKTGTMRNTLNLEDHPENQGKTLRVKGRQGTYLGTVGMSEEDITGEYELYD